MSVPTKVSSGLSKRVLKERNVVSEVAAHVSHEMSDALDLSTIVGIEKQAFNAEVADSHLLLMIDGLRRENDIVLMISNPLFPEAVSDAVERLCKVHEVLAPRLRRRLHMPLVAGRWEGRSYASFPRLDTLSSRRIQAALERRLVSRHVTSWLAEVALDTRQPVAVDEVARLFEQPLDYLCQETALSDRLRDTARCLRSEGLGQLEMVFTVVEHGDFWIGNLLFERHRIPLLASVRGAFRIIDWGGARRDGYAFIDLVRYCMSTRAPEARANRRDIERYRRHLGVDPEHIALHVLASLGRLGQARNEFPKERYVHLAGRMEAFLRLHGYMV